MLGHFEHHFNGFLTNKIPGFRKLNWYLVAVSMLSIMITQIIQKYFVGLENILKSFRIDYYWAFKDGNKFGNDFRIGLVSRLGRGRMIKLFEVRGLKFEVIDVNYNLLTRT